MEASSGSITRVSRRLIGLFLLDLIIWAWESIVCVFYLDSVGMLSERILCFSSTLGEFRI